MQDCHSCDPGSIPGVGAYSSSNVFMPWLFFDEGRINHNAGRTNKASRFLPYSIEKVDENAMYDDASVDPVSGGALMTLDRFSSATKPRS